MAEAHTYHTISSSSKGIYKEKGSRFLAYACRVQTEDACVLRIGQISKLHRSASHVCFAYRIHPAHPVVKWNDAGEPPNTAGKPILRQIEKHRLFNVLIVVARYFGGVKLGRGGLMAAYRSAAANALSNTETILQHDKTTWLINFDYEQMNNVMLCIKRYKARIINRDFGLNPSMYIEVNSKDSGPFFKEIIKLKGVSCQPVK